MGLMPVNDSMFMIAESREQPMHVGSLQLFDLPADAGPDFLGELYRSSLDVADLAPVYRKRPHRGPLTGGQWSWRDDRDIDLEHHVRHSALPAPGRIRELLALTGRLHGTLLDRHRPLWEAHLIEGLEGDRFALYTKFHHAVMDGISGLRLLQRSLSPDADERGLPVPWAERPRGPRAPRPDSGLLSLPRAALGLAGDAVGLTPARAVPGRRRRPRAGHDPARAGALDDVQRQHHRQPALRRRVLADRTGPRRRPGGGCTLNDVVLAMCGGALREYLLEQDALPATSLVAMTPVSLRDAGADDVDEPTNAVGTILARLGTDQADAGARLTAVKASMDAGKAALRGLSQNQVTALSAVVMAPLLFNELVSLHRFAPPPFNLVISNVPGPGHPLYWNGARLRGLYPLSIPTHGQALNITLTSYDGELQFGLVGCRRSVPRLQRLLVHLEESLAALEAAVL